MPDYGVDIPDITQPPPTGDAPFSLGRTALQAMAWGPGIWSNVVTPPEYENAPWYERLWHSGAVQNLYQGTVGLPSTILNAAQAIPDPMELMHLPSTRIQSPDGSTWTPVPYPLQEQNLADIEATKRKAEAEMSIPPPQNPTEKIINDAAYTMGTLVNPAAVIKLPGVIGNLLHFAAPPARVLPKVAPLVGGLTATLDSAIAGLDPTGFKQEIIHDITSRGNPSADAAPVPPPAAQSTPQGTAGPPTQPAPSAATNYGVDLSSPVTVATNTAAPSLSQYGIADDTTDASGVPDFSQSQGNTGWDWSKLGLSTLLGLGTFAGLVHGGKSIATLADRLGILDRAKQSVADANARVEGLNDPTKPATNVGEVPMPSSGLQKVLPLSEAATSFRQDWLDKGAVLKRLNDSLAETNQANPSFGASLNMTNDMAMNTKIEQQMKSPTSVFTGNTITPATDYLDVLKSMTPDERQLYNTRAWYADELDNRVIRASQGRDPKLNYTNIETNGYTDPTTGQYVKGLTDYIADADANPKVKAADQLAKKIFVQDQIKEAVTDGRLTAAQGADIQRTRPNWAPQIDATGNVGPSYALRDVSGTGTNEIPGNVWDAYAQSYANNYKDIARNSVNRDIVQRQFAAQQADPMREKIFSESKDADGNWQVPSTGHHVTIYTPEGAKIFRIHNTDVANALKGPPALQSAWLGGANRLRKMVQSGTTGPLAMLGGRFFALTHPVRMAAMIPVVRQQGMYAGYIDRALQQIGFTPGLRGDPTAYLNTINSAVRGIGAVFAKNIGEVLSPGGGSAFNRTLRGLTSDQYVNQLSARFNALHDNSILAESRLQGIGGSGAHGATEAQSNLTDMPKHVYTPWRRYAEELFPGATVRYAPGPLKGTAMTAIRTKNMVHDIFNVLADAAHDSYYRLNRGQVAAGTLTPEQLASNVRGVTGDPGIAGSGSWARGAASLFPYSNMSLQGTASLFRALKEAPIGTSMGLSLTLGTAALAEIYSAMFHGKDTVNYLANGLSTRQRGAGVNIFHSNDPTDRTEISLPQELRPFYPVMLELASHLVGAFTHEPGDQGYERTLHTLGDFLHTPVSYSTMTSTVHSLGDLFNIYQPPPPLNAVTAALGNQTYDANLDTIALNAIEGRPLYTGLAHDVTPKTALPNQPLPSNYFSKNDEASGKALISNLFGIAGEAVNNMLAFRDRYKATGDAGYAFSQLAGDIGQNIKDTNPMLGGVWNNNLAIPQSSPLVERVRKELADLQRTAGATTALAEQGLTRKGGQPVVEPPGDLRVPTDPVMRDMFIRSQRSNDFIRSKLLPPIQDIEKQIYAVQRGPMAAADKRNAINALTADMYSRYQTIDAHLTNLNDIMSNLAGTHVPRSGIDWTRGPEQFHQMP